MTHEMNERDPTNPFASRRINLNASIPGEEVAHFITGDKVRKVGGDYTFEGDIVSVFRKKSGVIRYVVEDDRGALHVYSYKNLAPR